MAPTANQLIDAALQKGVARGTTLQDAVKKLRRARRGPEELFEVALGELWVTASDYFKQRNEAIAKLQDLQFKYDKLQAECNLSYIYGD